MNVKEIIVHWLKKNEYDGLFSDSFDCGCTIDDLFLCAGQGFFETCKPGYKINENDPNFIGPKNEID